MKEAEKGIKQFRKEMGDLKINEQK